MWHAELCEGQTGQLCPGYRKPDSDLQPATPIHTIQMRALQQSGSWGLLALKDDFGRTSCQCISGVG
jgi:hypothetical protein